MQPAYYEDINQIKKKIWLMLNDAVKNRNSQFRIPTFICGDGNNIDGRIVVLRKSDEKNNLVQFHSDIRSDKIEILKKNSSAALLFYDKEEKIQVRLKVKCIINPSGLKPELDNFDYTKEQSEMGYKNFTVIQCKIKSIEWLYLAAKGHRRARFDLENNKDIWLVP